MPAYVGMKTNRTINTSENDNEVNKLLLLLSSSLLRKGPYRIRVFLYGPLLREDPEQILGHDGQVGTGVEEVVEFHDVPIRPPAQYPLVKD